jgi:hypothetical protein
MQENGGLVKLLSVVVLIVNLQARQDSDVKGAAGAQFRLHRIVIVLVFV